MFFINFLLHLSQTRGNRYLAAASTWLLWIWGNCQCEKTRSRSRPRYKKAEQLDLGRPFHTFFFIMTSHYKCRSFKKEKERNKGELGLDVLQILQARTKPTTSWASRLTSEMNGYGRPKDLSRPEAQAQRLIPKAAFCIQII